LPLTALASRLAFLPRPMTGSFASCGGSAATYGPRSQLSCRRRDAPMAPCSTPGEAQTFQTSRRQLFSHLRRRASAGKAPDPEGRTRQRQAATDRRQRWSPDRGSRPRAKMTRAIQQNARSGPAGTVSQPAQAWRQIGGSARVLPDLVHHSASPSIDVAGVA
jgi:hypothetical protein